METDLVISERKLQNLSKHKLQALCDKIGEIRKKKYPDKHKRKYGNLNKGFTEEELKKFLKGCRNEKTYLAFSLMAGLGLRVGEVVMIKIDDLDFVKNKIKIFTEKDHRTESMQLQILLIT